MRQTGSSWGSYVAAIILTALTLSVFAVSRDTGPESAVRQYLEACARGDRQGARAFITTDDEYGGYLAAQIQAVMISSQAVRLGGVRKSGRTAFVDVVFHFPNGITAVRFVVVKPGMRWRIDSQETLVMLRRMREFE